LAWCSPECLKLKPRHRRAANLRLRLQAMRADAAALLAELDAEIKSTALLTREPDA
jgi:hypothetical protein